VIYADLTDKQRRYYAAQVIRWRNKGEVPSRMLMRRYGLNDAKADRLLRSMVAADLLTHDQAFVKRQRNSALMRANLPNGNRAAAEKASGMLAEQFDRQYPFTPTQLPLPFIDDAPTIIEQPGRVLLEVPDGYEAIVIYKPKTMQITALLEAGTS